MKDTCVFPQQVMINAPSYKVFLPLPPTSYPRPAMGLEHGAAQKIVARLLT